MLIAVLSGFVLAAFAPLLHRLARSYTGWVVALLPLALFAYFAGYADAIAHEEAFSEVYAWVPSLNVDLAFYLDGLSLLLVLIVMGIGAFIMIYAGSYLHGDPLIGRFYIYILMFMASMVGMALADNLLTLFIFWELTSISSYLLIGYKHAYADSRAAALKALLVTGAGGLAMLAGLVLIGLVTNTWTISALAEQAETIQGSTLYLPILLLIGVGAFTKSAQFPFHFWLPGAMAAPTPVSAYLHSATMVKAGVYLLARLSPALSGTDEWRLLLTTVGVVTMLLGGYLSIQKKDLKRILAYSTVSSLGLLVALIGWDTKVAIEAAMLFLLVHSLYKGTLFLVAGTIDHETGTRNIDDLGGLLRSMPFIGISAALAGLSMAGIPLFLGFIGKELIYEATLGYEAAGWQPGAVEIFITTLAVITNVFFVAVAAMLFFVPFTGALKETPRHPHRAPFAMWIGPVVLSVLGLVFGLLPVLPGEYVVDPASESTYGAAVELHLHTLPTSINPMFILSLITLMIGALVFFYRARVNALLARVDVGPRIGPERLFDRGVDELPHTAKSITDIFQSGYLRYYVASIVGATVIVAGYTFLTRVGVPPVMVDIPPLRIYEVAIAIVILIGVVMILRSSNLLFTVVSLGVVGYGVALIFLLYGAPDLAMTQFSIETLTVILFVLVLYRLPNLAQLSSRRARIRDTIFAGLAGALITLIVLTVTAEPLTSPLTTYYSENSYTEAQGRNIVNVILVDFRGFDTMGEITVLAVAAIGVLSLLKLRPGSSRPEHHAEEEDEQELGDYS